MPVGFDKRRKHGRKHNRQTIWFEKSFGGGFAYVAVLGKGAYGCAILVRSMSNGKLYVRKEDLRCNRSAVVDNDEVLNATRAARVGTVPICHGWVKYQGPSGNAFGVSYWEYYKAGTLYSFLKRARETQHKIPMRWAFYFLATMLETMIRAHRAGIAHTDAHMANWFLTRNPMLDVPTIGLGDWGISIQEARVAYSRWFDACHEDYRLTAENLNYLVICQERPLQLEELLLGMNNALQRAKQSNRSPAVLHRLHTTMEDIRAEARQAVQRYARPSQGQEALIPHDAGWDKTKWTDFSDVKAAIRRDTNLQKLKHFDVAECMGDKLKVTGRSNDHFAIVKHGGFR